MSAPAIPEGWQAGPIAMATKDGPFYMRGYRKGFLAVITDPDIPILHRVAHVPTGGIIATFPAPQATAFVIADELAAATDWDFGDMIGWQNMDPDLPDKTVAILKRHGINAKLSTADVSASDREHSRQAGKLNGYD